MVIRPKLNHIKENLGNKILCFLHYRYAHSEDVVFTNDEISDCIIGANKRHIGLALSELLERGLIYMEPGDPSEQIGTGFLINSNGISIVEQWSDGEYGAFSDGINFLDDGREQPLDDIPIVATTPDDKPFSNAFSDEFAKVPASDRTVTLNDNQVEDATKHIENFIKEFQQDHHFNNEWAAEKTGLIKTLEAGKEYLEAKILDIRVGTVLILGPLRTIAEKYKDPAINGTFSALAQKALEFFINLFAG